MDAPGPQEFIDDLLPAIRQAAAIARALEGRVANRPKSGEPTDVKAALTMADTAAQEALLVPLLARFARVRLAAEEDTPSVKRFTGECEALVVIDPIDGTLRSYLEAGGPYAVMAGLALEGRYRAALVALPREGWVFHAVAGAGAHAGPLATGGPTAPARARDDGRSLLVSHDLPEGVAEHLEARGYRLGRGCGGAVAVAPLLDGVCGGLRVPRPGETVSVRGRIGALVAREAGARLATGTGAPLPEHLDTPLDALAVAASDAVLDDLVAALAA